MRNAVAVAICSRHPGAASLTARLGQQGARVLDGVCCTDPSLGARLRRLGLGALAVAACADSGCALRVEESAARAGIPAWARSVILPPAAAIEPAERTAARLVARARRLDGALDVPPDRVVVRYRMRRPVLTRRGLFALATWRDQQVAPGINPARCRAAFGCRCCADACPHRAVTLHAGIAAIDEDRCTGCGLCAGVCPVDAVDHPTAGPAAVAAEVSLLVQQASFPRLIAFRCQDDLRPLPSPYLDVSLPCAAAASVAHVLAAFIHGADGVAIVLGPGWCAGQHAGPQARERHAACRSLMRAAGLDPGRSALAGSLDALCAFAQAVAAMPARRATAGERTDDGTDTLQAGLAALLRDAPAPPALLDDEDAPLAVVGCDPMRCTVCGVCANTCPTGALQCAAPSDRIVLTFEHAICHGCRRCEDVCPERALGVRRGIDPSLLREPAILAEDTLLRCRLCGERIGPLRLAKAVQARLTVRSTGGGEAPDLCPRCRLTEVLGAALLH